MALIDVVTWAPDGELFVFAHKYPESNLSTYTQLIVQESQEALLFSKGELMGKFGPGKHQLNTENLPVLSSLYGLPFGGKNPFTAEVWYVNKLMPANLAWEINRMTIHDVDYDTQLPLTAFGQYGVKVVNSARFLKRMVGTKTEFTQNDMVSQAWGEFATKVKSTVVQFMTTNRIGFKYISAYLDQLSSYLKENLTAFWDDYGLELTKFYVSSIDIDDSSEDGKRVKDAISEQSSMSITGHTWQQERAFGMAESAIGKMGGDSGSGGGLLGSIMALNMMNSMQSQIGGGMMQSNYNQPHFNSGGSNAPRVQGGQMGTAGAAQTRMVFCAGCSKKHSTSEHFCPHCGKEYHPCPSCGADNLESAKRCVSCGTSLVQNIAKGSCSNVCPSCGAQVTPGAAFCSSCGTSLQQTKKMCSRCGTPVESTQKFCPVCGNKL
jgi:membrane protease subunit (stomatin/prohibitin family)